jgi:hypothetical protein
VAELGFCCSLLDLGLAVAGLDRLRSRPNPKTVQSRHSGESNSATVEAGSYLTGLMPGKNRVQLNKLCA